MCTMSASICGMGLTLATRWSRGGVAHGPHQSTRGHEEHGRYAAERPPFVVAKGKLYVGRRQRALRERGGACATGNA